MRLHRRLADAEPPRNLSVVRSGADEERDLALARGEEVEPPRQARRRPPVRPGRGQRGDPPEQMRHDVPADPDLASLHDLDGLLGLQQDRRPRASGKWPASGSTPAWPDTGLAGISVARFLTPSGAARIISPLWRYTGRARPLRRISERRCSRPVSSPPRCWRSPRRARATVSGSAMPWSSWAPPPRKMSSGRSPPSAGSRSSPPRSCPSRPRC